MSNVMVKERQATNYLGYAKLENDNIYLSVSICVEPTEIKATDEIKLAFYKKDWDFLQEVYIKAEMANDAIYNGDGLYTQGYAL